jgi:hypothetical protein
MSEFNLKFEPKTAMAEFESELMHATLKRYFEIIRLEPVLTIGNHIETGGLLCIPHANAEASTADVLAILRRAVEYIELATEEGH